MKLEYVGNKPVISARGVDFSIGKEDKYVYIEAAAQMLDFLGKLEKTTKLTINPRENIDEEKIFKVLHKYRPDFDKFFSDSVWAYKNKIDAEISDVDSHDRLNNIEKEVLKNNLSYMKDYRIQRATNKLVYEELINACVDIIRKKGISEITMPFSLSFVHVAKSFDSSLTRINRAVVAKVEVMLDKEDPYTRLNIVGFGNI
ncbi:hypothetical protein SMGD1_2837 [Sulfurimonas gotlandica GD1]|jgi:uncharacterized membrane protein YheB (UPF0754 family)|uniref:Uncharacterized protein n=1 Tax=Sulfurimonas gotlandica (strain DSM 19862 / JCM 16533 / GD1) TaxID=929558 RepID=B6BJV8_SULGG|nr:hypothetical protein [Sulfurimonas gotlandica]EDZ62738.1 hypothetical protein CBGD1_2305 [Sulfurimonas gotlandica GD1]EHP31359.1 hypothetical protein SMGD1_2837 [Sulfurimonas gotlandica GD1]